MDTHGSKDYRHIYSNGYQLKRLIFWTSLTVQWLRLQTSNAITGTVSPHFSLSTPFIKFQATFALMKPYCLNQSMHLKSTNQVSTFSLSSFTFIKRLFSSSSLSVIMVMPSAYLRLLIFLLPILIPACASFSPGVGDG